MERWKEDPNLYAVDRFGPSLDGSRALTPEQCEFMLAVVFGEKTKVAVKAAGKVGKSRGAGVLAYWVAECHGYARVNALSATGDNLEEVLWRELGDLWDLSQKAEYPLSIPRPPKDPKAGFDFLGCRIVGFFAAKVEAIGGIGGAKQLFIVDEASSEKFDLLYDGIRHNTMSGKSRMLILGNPTRPVGVFHSLWRNSPEKASWERFTLSAATLSKDEKTASAKYNYPGTGLSDQDAVNELIRDYGVKSDFVKVRILGEFAETGENAVVSMAWIDAATRRYSHLLDAHKALDLEKAKKHLSEPLHLGVDVAWKGNDNSVIYPRRGLLVLEPTIIHGRNPSEVAIAVLQVADRLAEPGEVVRVKVDTVGVGGGTWSDLDTAARERRNRKAACKHSGKPCDVVLIEPVCVNVGERPTSKPTNNSPGYVRLRDQLWFAGAYFLRDGGILTPCPRLEEELLMPTFSYDSALKILVESKDEVKKRLKRSPDLADAFNLAVYEGVPAAEYTSKVKNLPAPPWGQAPIGGGDWGNSPIGI